MWIQKCRVCAVPKEMGGNRHQFPEVPPSFIFSPTALLSNNLSFCLEEHLDSRSHYSNSKIGSAVCLFHFVCLLDFQRKKGHQLWLYSDKHNDMLIRRYTSLFYFFLFPFFTVFIVYIVSLHLCVIQVFQEIED